MFVRWNAYISKPRTENHYRMLLGLLCQLAWAAEHSNPPPKPNGNDTRPGLICTPFGICEPCSEDAVRLPPRTTHLIAHNEQLGEPFCQPFGNRRLMHCINGTLPPPSSHGEFPSSGQTKSVHPEGETLAWESCGRIVGQERADFYEFVACNVLFAIIALVVLFARSKRLHAMQARQLAARIGIIQNPGGSGRR